MDKGKKTRRGSSTRNVELEATNNQPTIGGSPHCVSTCDKKMSVVALKEDLPPYNAAILKLNILSLPSDIESQCPGYNEAMTDSSLGAQSQEQPTKRKRRTCLTLLVIFALIYTLAFFFGPIVITYFVCNYNDSCRTENSSVSSSTQFSVPLRTH